MGMRDRGVEPADFCQDAIRMLGDIAHQANAFLDIVQRSRGIEFDDVQTLVLEQLPCGESGETAGDHNIRFEDQHIFGRARQLRKLPRLGGVPRAGRIARIGAQS
jgi:hypothetical protein